MTTEKVKNINILTPLPYEPEVPEQAEEMEVVDEEDVSSSEKEKKNNPDSKKEDLSDDQKTLFD